MGPEWRGPRARVLTLALAMVQPAVAGEVTADAYHTSKIAGRVASPVTELVADVAASACSAPCTDGTLLATQPFYEILLACGNGRFAARTGVQHPLTLASGEKQDVVFAGALGLPDFSDIMLRVHDNETSYGLPAGGEACAFDPSDTVAEPGNVGLRGEWALSPLPGVELVLSEELVAFGGEAADAGVRVTLSVENRPTSIAPVTIGLRWQVDFANASDDGPLVARIGCDPVVAGPELAGEHEFAAGELGEFLRLRNNQGGFVYSNFLATAPLTGFADSYKPDRVVFGEWGSLESSPWDYIANEGNTGVDLDSAVLFYYGYDASEAMTVAPGEVVRRSVVLVSSAATAACPLGTCASTGSPLVEAGPDQSYCPGASLTLDASATVAPSCPSFVEYRFWDPLGSPLSGWTSSPVRTVVPSAGLYRVDARCASYANCIASDTVRLWPNVPASAEFLAPSEVCFGCAPASFTDASTGSIGTWEWSFGDGEVANQPNPTHVFRSAGDLPVQLTVTDTCGRVSVRERIVRVVSVPVAEFAALSEACAGSAVDFVNASSLDASSFLWDFGDGSPGSSAITPTHVFVASGTYEVALVASNGCGDSTPVRHTVIVSNGSTAAFTSDAPRCQGAVSFRDASSGDPLSWSWDFGDGSPLATIPNPTHAYATSGTYVVSLTVATRCGSDVAVGSVTVSPTIGDPFPRWDQCEAARLPGVAPSPPYSPADTTAVTTASTSWEFNDSAFCRASPCTFAMYVVADCGTAMKIPLYDNETGRIRVYDLLRDAYVPLEAVGAAVACPWQQTGVTEASWQDCAGNDCRWNNATTTVSFGGSGTAVCGVYRLELVDWGGYYWDLFANCDGSSAPGFRIYDNVCDALDAYAPLPELEVQNVAVTGLCPNYVVSFEVRNRGCRTVDVPVRVSVSVGGTLDLVVAGIEPDVPRQVVAEVSAASCAPAVINVHLDPADVVRECSEAQGSSVSCNPDPGAGHVATFDLARPCVDPPVFCGVTVAEDLDACMPSGVRISWPEVIAAGGGGGALYDVYRDDLLIATRLTDTSYLDVGGTAGVAYRYRVQAVNGCGLGDASVVEAMATDQSLTAVEAGGGTAVSTPSDCVVRVDWSPAIGAGPIAYDLYRSELCPATIAHEQVASGLTVTGYDDAVMAGDSYCYVIEAVGACGTVVYASSSRVAARDLTPPIEVIAPSFRPAPPCGLVLDWAVVESCGSVTYEIHRSRTTPWTPDPWTEVARVSALPFTDVLPRDDRYEYRLVARNPAGLGTASSLRVAELVGCATDCEVPRLSARRALMGARRSGGLASWRWSEDPGAEAYHLNAVGTKSELVGEARYRLPRGAATAACDAFPPECTDADPPLSSGERVRFYTVVSSCGPSGDDEGP